MKYSSPKLDRINPSASLIASEKARELRQQGHDIISLAAGEPDFPTPDHVKAAAIKAIETGELGYTDVRGIAPLRQAIRRKFLRDNRLDFSDAEIIAGPGAKSLIGYALTATVSAGDEVLIPAPCWVSYIDMAKLVDGMPVVVPARLEDNLKITPEALEAAITPRTRWLMLNSPNNPTGSVFTVAELRALAEVLLRHPQVLVMTDEIYEHLLFDGTKFVSFVEAAPELRDRTLTINGASKAYAMTGWRLGYAAGPAALVKAMAKVAGQMVGSISVVAQMAAIAALDGPQDYLETRAAEYATRRDRAMQLLADIPGLSVMKPKGAFYLYVNCAGLIGQQIPSGTVLKTDADVVNWLIDTALVATVAGAAYGLSPYFRISIATSIEQIETACKRIARAVSGLRASSQSALKDDEALSV